MRHKPPYGRDHRLTATSFFPCSIDREHLYGYAGDGYRSPLWLCASHNGSPVLVHRLRGSKIYFHQATKDRRILLIPGIHYFDAHRLQPLPLQAPVLQGNKERSERNSPNRACIEIHHEFRAASKELESLQQLNKELWEMNMGLKEINKAPGDINTGLRDINQKPRKQKDVQGQELWETKRGSGK